MTPKNIPISLDINQSFKQTNYELVTNDTKVYQFVFKIYDGSKVYNYADIASATIKYVRPDNKETTRNLTNTGNDLRRIVELEEIAIAGVVNAEIHLYGTDGERITTSAFSFKVRNELGNGTPITEMEEYPVLTELIADYNTMVYDETTQKTYEQIRQEKEDIREQNEEQRKITNNELQGSISTGQQTKIDIDNSINNAINEKENLDISINTSITKKGELDSSISTANTTKANLEDSINSGNTSKSNLDNSKQLADLSKQNLDESIVLSESKKIALDDSIDSAVVKYNDLYGKINEAETVNTTLNGNVAIGTNKITEINNKIVEVNGKISEATSKIAQTETARQNAINATTNVNNAIDSATIVWKTPVASYSAIASIYPSPSLGWVVQALDTGNCYRWNGSTWFYAFRSNIIPTMNYLWIETKTVNSGGNSFTLTNDVGVGHKLLIKDLKYGCNWLETTHWTISGKVITLTETALSETLTFEIINLG